MQVLETAGANFAKAFEAGQDPLLFQAAKEGELDLVRHEVLDVGEDINKVGMHYEGLDFTPLMVAAKAGHLDVVKFLLQHGANPELLSNIGLTALMLAAKFGRKDVAKQLLKHGANVNGTCRVVEGAPLRVQQAVNLGATRPVVGRRKRPH